MNLSPRRRLAIVLAACAALLGGAVAAVAVGEGSPRVRTSGKLGGARLTERDMLTAASYLGVTRAQLASELQSGKNLAQVASATSGRSAAGLIEALVAAKRSRLAALAAGVPKRVTAEVNRSGGGIVGAGRGSRAGERGAAGRGGRFAGHRGLGAVAARYLGMTMVELRAQLRAGKTLADVANSTPGRSATALIDALVAARKGRLAAQTAAGTLTGARAEAISARLTERMTALVSRTDRLRR